LKQDGRLVSERNESSIKHITNYMMINNDNWIVSSDI